MAKLDGEELVETMYSVGNKDSLVSWLDFKNDDEFRALFGSIARGNAFKSGKFRRKETSTGSIAAWASSQQVGVQSQPAGGAWSRGNAAE